MNITVGGSADTEQLRFRSLKGNKKYVYRHPQELAILTAAVERIKDRTMRRALGLYLGIWNGEPFTSEQIAQRFDLHKVAAKRLLREAAQQVTLDPTKGRLAISIPIGDQDGHMKYLEFE